MDFQNIYKSMHMQEENRVVSMAMQQFPNDPKKQMEFAVKSGMDPIQAQKKFMGRVNQTEWKAQSTIKNDLANGNGQIGDKGNLAAIDDRMSSKAQAYTDKNVNMDQLQKRAELQQKYGNTNQVDSPTTTTVDGAPTEVATKTVAKTDAVTEPTEVVAESPEEQAENQAEEKDKQETTQSLAQLSSAVEKSEMSEENKQKYAKLSQEATDIQNALGDWIKKFKSDPSIKTLVNRYSGKEAKQQAKDAKAQAKAQAKLGESVEHMEEAKGGFMFHYKNFIKAAGKVRVWAVVGLALIATAVVGGAGFGIIKSIIKSAKSKDALEKGLQGAVSGGAMGGVNGADQPVDPTSTDPTNPTDPTSTDPTNPTDPTSTEQVGGETTTTTTEETQTTEETPETPEEVKEELVEKPVEDAPAAPLGGKTTKEWVQEQQAAGKSIPQIIQEYEAQGFSRNGPKFLAAMVALFGGITLVSTTINPTTKEVIGSDATDKSYKIDTNSFTASAIPEQQKAQEIAKAEQGIAQNPEAAKEVAQEVAKGEDVGPNSSGADQVETQEQVPVQQAQEQQGATPDIPKVQQKGKALSVGEWIIAQSKKGNRPYNTKQIQAGIKHGGVVFTKHAAQYYWGPKDSAFFDANGRQKPNVQINQSSHPIEYGDPDVLAVKTENGFNIDPTSSTSVHVVYLDNAHNNIIGCQKPTDTQFLLSANGDGGIQPKSIDEIVETICQSSDKSNNQNIGIAGGAGAGYGALIGTAICPGVGTLLGSIFGGMAGLISSSVLGSIFSNAASFCKNISWESMTPTSKAKLINWSASHLNAGAIGNGANEQEMQKLQNVAQQAKSLMAQKVNYVGAPGESIQTALTNIRIEAVNQAKKALGA